MASSFNLGASSLVSKVNRRCSGGRLAAIVGIQRRHRRLKYTFESHCGLDIVMGVHSVQNYRRNMVEARRTEHVQPIRDGAGET